MDSAAAQALRQRLDALSRFDRWAARHPVRLAPDAAVRAAGQLYELLPGPSRSRPVDADGVMALHSLLRRCLPAGR